RNKEVGFIFQTFNLLPRADALHNVELPLIYAGMRRRERVERARRALERVGLSERMHHRPSEMSGGQRQRVAVARALVTDPRVLLADEPAGVLDRAPRRDIMALSGNLCTAGHTRLLVTHETDIAKHALRAITFRGGRIDAGVINNERSP